MEDHEVPEDLTKREQALFSAWMKKNYPRWNTRERKRELVNACLSHHAATGNRRRYVAWLPACRNWVTKQAGIERERKRGNYADETPQEARGGDSQEPERLADILPLFPGITG